MTAILYAILVILNLKLGSGNHAQQASKIYQSGDYKIENGIVIIDTDEL